MRSSEDRGAGLQAGQVMLAVAVVVFAGLRLHGLAEYPLDGDEIYSFLTCRLPWAQFGSEIVRDAIHPPLFYLLLRGWMRVGGSALAWVRLLPALAAIGCLAPLMLLARDWKLPRLATGCAIFVLAVNPVAIYYAQHLRMYSLLMLLALIAVWLLARLVDGDQSAGTLGWLTALNLAMVYTQYYGWVAVGLEGLAIVVWRRDLVARFLGGVAVVAALFAPWAWLAAGALSAKGGLETNLGWVPAPTWKDFTWYFARLGGLTDLPYAGHWAIAGLAVLAAASVVRRDRRGWLLLMFGVLPATVAYAASMLLPQSIWGTRHLLMSAAPLYLWCGILLSELPRVWLRTAAVAALCVLSTADLASDLRKPDLKLRWDQVTDRLDASPPEPVHLLDEYVDYPLRFHLGESPIRLVHTKPNPSSGAGWAIYSHSVYEPDPDWPAKLQNRGCQTGEETRIRDRFREVVLFPVTCAI